MGKEDISTWSAEIESAIARCPSCCIDRVVVVESVESTMDEAIRRSGNLTGLLVVSSEQTAGRGQRGRRWDDADRCTLPCSWLIDATQIEPTRLAAIVGCAVHQTLCAFVPSTETLMIKWPNDLVIRSGERERKVAGILIEQSNSITNIGIGINCAQAESDWSPETRSRRVSLAQLGARVNRLELVCMLIEHLSRWIAHNDPIAIRAYDQAHNAMVSTRRSFMYNNKRITGIVDRLDPLSWIEVRTSTRVHRLPVAQTRHLGDEPIGE